MFSASHLNRWALSISTAAITVVGTFSPITISSVAAQTGACVSNADFNSGTRDLTDDITKTETTFKTLPNGDDKPPQNISSASQDAAQDAALALYPNNSTPNTLFTRYDVDAGVLEFRGKQPNGCPLEVDVLQSNRIEEIEQQIQTLGQVPAPVRNKLNQELPNTTTIVVEKSTRPNRVVGPNDSLNGDPVFYEIEVSCTGANPRYCTKGQFGEATISANGNNFEFELSQD